MYYDKYQMQANSFTGRPHEAADKIHQGYRDAKYSLTKKGCHTKYLSVLEKLT